MIREMSQCRCTMLERSSYFKFALTHAVWGTKLSLHLITAQMLVPLMVEQCAAHFHRSWAQVPF